MSAHRCGVAALLGRPNAGKSTLLNALLGAKLAIATARAQTTRSRLLGVLTLSHAQILFYDTPGVHRGERRFNAAMTRAALEAAEDADLRVLLLDAGSTWDAPEERIAEVPGPTILCVTKQDLATGEPTIPGRERFEAVIPVSAHTGTGLSALLDAIVARLPEGPALHPADALTDAPLRFLAAEQIREVAFERLRDEVPYALAVEVDEWKEDSEALRLRASLLVERDSQKGIVIGREARMLKGIGTEARRRLAGLVEKPVHLALWVKVDPNWTRRLRRVRELGYLS